MTIEFPASPRGGVFKKDLNDCTVSDLRYLINHRREMREITGEQHSDECESVTRVMQILVDGMIKQGASTVGDLDQNQTLGDLM
jgi:hypothetical protein